LVGAESIRCIPALVGRDGASRQECETATDRDRGNGRVVVDAKAVQGLFRVALAKGPLVPPHRQSDVAAWDAVRGVRRGPIQAVPVGRPDSEALADVLAQSSVLVEEQGKADERGNEIVA